MSQTQRFPARRRADLAPASLWPLAGGGGTHLHTTSPYPFKSSPLPLSSLGAAPSALRCTLLAAATAPGAAHSVLSRRPHPPASRRPHNATALLTLHVPPSALQLLTRTKNLRKMPSPDICIAPIATETGKRLAVEAPSLVGLSGLEAHNQRVSAYPPLSWPSGC